MSSKIIEIQAKGTRSIPLGKLKNFQGNLKELREAEYNKLKKSILKYGFRIPIFVWKDNTIDGHSRLFVLRKLLKEGYKLSDNNIPVIDIPAKNVKEAKELLLMINNRYGKITPEGLYEFIESAEIKFDELKTELDLPGIDMNSFSDSFYNDNDIKKNKKSPVGIFYTCPSCGHKFK